MKKFKLVRNKNGKFIIKEKALLFFWEPILGTGYFNTYMDCVNYIYSKYDKDKCIIKYNANW